ncbi:hypothetical protein FOC4_h10017255, partial [Fusarium odoratissimum]
MKTNTEAQPSVASGGDPTSSDSDDERVINMEIVQIPIIWKSHFGIRRTLIDTCARNQPPKGNKGLDIVDGPKPPLHKPVRDPAAARRVVPWSSI